MESSLNIIWKEVKRLTNEGGHVAGSAYFRMAPGVVIPELTLEGKGGGEGVSVVKA